MVIVRTIINRGRAWGAGRGVLDLLEGALDPGLPGRQATARGCRPIRTSGGAGQGQGAGFPPPGMALGRVGSMGRAWGVKVGKLGGWGNHPRRQVGLRSRTLMTHPTPPNFGV